MKTDDSSTSMLARANTALVRYPRFNELHKDISLCQEMSLMAGEPSCMALEGITGAGKSTLVKAYAEAFARYDTITRTKIPVFYIETPSPITVKGLAARMLEVLGDPAAHKGTLGAMNSRLYKYIEECEVQLVILDDFHHLIDRDTNRILDTVSDWLKVLIKESGIPYLVVGIEGKVEQILQANPQLSRLFAVRETLRPFEWQPSDKSVIQEFASFIQYAEQAVGLPLTTEVSRIELLEKIHYATSGVVGNIMNLLRFATLLAQHGGSDTLSLRLLSQAYEKRLRKHVGKSKNPFVVSNDQLSTPEPTGLADAPESVSRRSKPRKERQPDIADVLTTG